MRRKRFGGVKLTILPVYTKIFLIYLYFELRWKML